MCIKKSNRKCKIQPILINLHPNEYSQELQYYPFAVTLDKCDRSCVPKNGRFRDTSIIDTIYNINIYYI